MAVNGDDCGGCDQGIFFEDKNDRIETTSGDIAMDAIDSVIDIGSLKTTGGAIALNTSGSGHIKARDLTVAGVGEGEAQIAIDSAGNVEVDGNIEATQTETTGDDETETSAAVNITAADSVAITGDVTVQAESQGSEEDVSGTKANALLDITAGDDIAMDGAATVTATAIAEGDDVSDTFADARMALEAGQNVTIGGDTDVSATANAEGEDETADTNANATLAVSSAEGDVKTLGSVNVAATATADAEDVSDTFANVLADLFAARDVLMESWVKAKSSAGGYGKSDTNDTSSFTALNAVSTNADAEGDVIAKDDVEASAETDAYGEDVAHAASETTLCLIASENATTEGGVKASAFTDNHATGDATDTTASSALHVRAGKDSAGDVLAVGDTSSTATAFAGDAAEEGEGPEAYAYHTLEAEDNVSVAGATDSTAIAEVDAEEAYGTTKAGSWLTIAANGNDADADSGLLTVDGPVTVLADAAQVNGDETYYDGAEAHANGTITAKRDATVGDVEVAAYANSDTDTEALAANAVLDIESGGDASVNTIYSEASTEDKGESFAHTRVAAAGDIILNSDIDPRAEADGAFVQQRFTGDDTNGNDFAELILTPGGDITDGSSSGGGSSSSSGGDNGGSSSSSGGDDNGGSSSSSGGDDDGGSSSSSGGDDDGGSSSSSGGGSGSSGGSSGSGSSSGGDDSGGSSSSSGGSSSGGDVSGTPDDVTVLSSLTLGGRFNPDALLAAALGQLSPAAGNREFCEVVNTNRKLQPESYRARICNPKREEDDA